METPMVRCAIYTRKSNQNGLEREYNSIEAQGDSCRNYIESQKDRGFVALPESYDDPGYTGGDMNRPAFTRLVNDAMAGKIDCIIVYKIDRFSRDLLEALCMLKTFREHNVMCRSVTEDFDTTTSHGTFMLHSLLSTAEYQRRQTAERIRDKVALAKAKGKHCGGTTPYGYDLENHKLVVNKHEAAIIQRIFKRFAECGSALTIARELNQSGYRTKTWTTRNGRRREGRLWNGQHIFRVLNNRKYRGEVIHKGKTHKGEHEAIVSEELWEKAHAVFTVNRRVRANATKTKDRNLLRGLLVCGHCRTGMYASFSRKRNRKYLYYLCGHASRNGRATCTIRSVPAAQIEAVITKRVLSRLNHPAVMQRVEARLRNFEADTTLEKIKQQTKTITEVWDSLFGEERERIVHLLVERIEVQTEGIQVNYRGGGAESLIGEVTELTPRGHVAETVARVASPSLRGGSGFLEPKDFVPTGEIEFIPLSFNRRCGRKVVVVPDGAEMSSPTIEPNPLIQAIARGFEWQSELASGKYDTHKELASALGVNRSYVSRLIRLTRLAPDIIQSILDGREPSGLSIEALTLRDCPMEWDKQREVYGFPPLR